MQDNKRFRLMSVFLIVFAVMSTIGGLKISAGDTYPVVVVDDMGRKVAFEKQPQRFISLSPSWTEILYALDLGGQVVGVTQYCDYPAEAAQKPKIGGFSNPSIETMVSLKPDVVFGTTMHLEVSNELERRGIKFICQNPSSVEGVMNNVRMAAQIAGIHSEEEKVTVRMQQQLDQVTKAVAKVPEKERLKVLYIVWLDDLVMSVGPKSLIHNMVTLAGGINITQDGTTDYPSYSLEAIVAKNPDVILAALLHNGGGIDPSSLKTRPGWQIISAVKNDRIVLVDDNLVSRSGPRVAEGVLEIARALYPNSFK